MLFILVSIKYPSIYFEVHVFISLTHQVQVQITYECLDTRFFRYCFVVPALQNDTVGSIQSDVIVVYVYL